LNTVRKKVSNTGSVWEVGVVLLLKPVFALAVRVFSLRNLLDVFRTGRDRSVEVNMRRHDQAHSSGDEDGNGFNSVTMILGQSIWYSIE